MTTSGTFSYAPSLGELVLYSFARCGIRRTAIAAEHMQDARMAANMVLAAWANEQPNLWTVDLQSVNLIPGQATYSVPPETVLILDAYIRTFANQPTQTDRIIYPVSRSEYAAFPDKVTPGFPTTYWFDRLISPTITLWMPPDTNGPYTLQYYRVRQMQDAVLQNGDQVEIPYRFLKAFADALSAELAVIYAPDRAIPLAQAAAMSFQKAADRDAEDVPLYVTPGLSGYFTGT